MENHDEEVLAPRVHEYGGIQRMQIEATLYKIEQLDLIGHDHAEFPVYIHATY